MDSTPLIKICCHFDDMSIPKRGHETDAGIDLTAMAVEQKRPDIFFFDTGISIHLSTGYYVEIVPRSSIINTDFILANSVGIIDPDYRGRIFLPFRYIGESDGMQAAEVLLQQRIAQMLVRKLEPCRIEVVDSLEETERGAGGFGSTGF
ncbi:MAG TPA: dUTP diphosphatase [Candidatus Lambdaproteobacteria bacterium]|nr:dUTP pyrophosphatase [Deltaproteobacteria bacterium]HHZ78263.1 dUTP diphosphatase [Candidatus Lambdaproteobacteria bacterium]HIA58239.1 dUTP diphosphatase [Candidatus Lambdaproteobacteria bacterium]HIB45929.1 dUTP diphosphatase [Candidatus Lambdaproteobacteria bacterium]HIB93199.1 dUTP diphosphatase [Candidatus Lambdaproteobacteria bacterium]